MLKSLLVALEYLGAYLSAAFDGHMVWLLDGPRPILYSSFRDFFR